MRIVVIHDEKLIDRVKYINGTLHKLKEMFPSLDIHMIKEPSKIDKKDIKSKLKLEKIEDNDFDKHISPMNQEQALNFEKHKKALELCTQYNECFLILEDDIVISNEYTNNIRTLLSNLEYDWDILFASFSMNADDTNDTIKYIDTLPQYKVLPSKSSYMITPKLAKNLLFYFETYKYPQYRIALSRFIWDNKDWVRSKTLDKHIFLETSKLGMSPSTINHSNTLMYNIDYVRMIQMVCNDVSHDTLNEAKELFNKNKKLESADFYHIMGILYHRREMYDDAKEMLLTAISLMEQKQGYLGRYSEILNNTINIFQYNQPDVEKYGKMKSKY